MRGAAAFGLCAALAWLAQFHHLRDFGLYEDDYFFIAPAMAGAPDYLAGRFHTAFTALPQGRPFGFFLPDLLSFVGARLGGLTAIYGLGWLIVSLNTFLAYRLLRTRLPVAPSIAGAAVFCLFPSDTTKILLTHDFQLQPALTFALLAALAYATGRTWLTYVLGAGALLSYESGYLALFGLPLFARAWDRRLPRALGLNALALVIVLVAGVAARFVAGEGRATSSASSLDALLPPLLGSLVLGPTRALAGMAYGPLRSVVTWDLETAVCAVIAVGAFAALLWRASRSGSGSVRAALRVAAAGAVMLVLGYGLAFTHFPPNALVGRGTSVHLGATLGMSVLAAGLAWALLLVRRPLAVALLSVYLAVAVGYYVSIERDFVRAWHLQQAFWRDVAACCSDLQDGTVLLYELNPTDEPQFIFSNSWADALILDETYAFPRDWSQPPRLFSLTAWQDRVQGSGNDLMWWVPGASWDEHWEPLTQRNVIVLRRGPDGHLVRLIDPIPLSSVSGAMLELKPVGGRHDWPPAQLAGPLLQ